MIDLHQFGLFVESQSFDLKSFNLGSTGLLTRELLPGGPVVQRWIARLSSANEDRTEWRQHSGLIASLRGTIGKARCFDPAKRRPLFDELGATTSETWDDSTTWDDGTSWVSGTLPPSVAVAQAGSRQDRTLLVDGFPASTQLALRWGDLFEIKPNGAPADHGHLYIITAACHSDASGKSLLAFEPGLRTNIAPGDKVSLRDPSTVFRLASDDEGEINVTAPHIGRFGLSLVEVLPRA
jgi:hypothetical protein